MMILEDSKNTEIEEKSKELYNLYGPAHNLNISDSTKNLIDNIFKKPHRMCGHIQDYNTFMKNIEENKGDEL